LHLKNIKNCYKYLQSKYEENIKEINILIKIEKEYINKEIYFLDKGYGKNENGNWINDHNNLDELNKLNTKIIY